MRPDFTQSLQIVGKNHLRMVSFQLPAFDIEVPTSSTRKAFRILNNHEHEQDKHQLDIQTIDQLRLLQISTSICHNLQHTRQVPQLNLIIPGTLQIWRKFTGAPLLASPLFDGDDTCKPGSGLII